VPDDPAFQPNLYRGTSEYYDRFRVVYPVPMIEDLAIRAELTGSGRLLDLACGTGQITFAMADRFAEVWAVDEERDMVDVVQQKALTLGTRPIRAICAGAATLAVPSEFFELVGVGNAFHRLDREPVTALILDWLRPGGCVALLWSTMPWMGDRDWQQAFSSILETWKSRTASSERIPEGWERARSNRPDAMILGQAGFDLVGSYRFPTDHRWTIPDLIGNIYSTSFLPALYLEISPLASRPTLPLDCGLMQSAGR